MGDFSSNNDSNEINLNYSWTYLWYSGISMLLLPVQTWTLLSSSSS